jgi:hypothetical protein
MFLPMFNTKRVVQACQFPGPVLEVLVLYVSLAIWHNLQSAFGSVGSGVLFVVGWEREVQNKLSQMFGLM